MRRLLVDRRLARVSRARGEALLGGREARAEPVDLALLAEDLAAQLLDEVLLQREARFELGQPRVVRHGTSLAHYFFSNAFCRKSSPVGDHLPSTRTTPASRATQRRPFSLEPSSWSGTGPTAMQATAPCS